MDEENFENRFEERYNPTLESLLQDMIANQHSMNQTIMDLYEKINTIANLEDRVAELEAAAGEDATLRDGDEGNAEERFEEAKEVAISAGKVTTSLLERKLGVGYSMAAQLIDMLEQEGVVGPADGANPREVIIVEEELWERE